MSNESSGIFDRLEAQSTKKKNRIMLVAIAVIVLVCLGVAVWWLFQIERIDEVPSDTSSPETITSERNFAVSEVLNLRSAGKYDEALAIINEQIDKNGNVSTDAEQLHVVLELEFWRGDILIEMGGRGEEVVDYLLKIDERGLDDGQRFTLWSILKSAYSDIGDEEKAAIYLHKINEYYCSGSCSSTEEL